MSALTSSTVTSPSTLPYELYDEIAGHLHNWNDRGPLLSLALASSAWRETSQRVLYTEFCDIRESEEDPQTALARRALFLSRIIEAPARLGPYVCSYVQRMWPEASNNVGKFWQLLVQALPAMVRLRHLCINFNRRPYPAPPLFSSGCTFRLRSLIMCHLNPDEFNEAIDFLPSQPEIRHLRLSYRTPESLVRDTALSCLPSGVCPKLLSTSCAYASVEHLKTGRNLLALDTILDRAPSSPALNVGSLRYLSLANYIHQSLLDSVTIFSNNIVLLKLRISPYKHERFPVLRWRLPNLRILVLDVSLRPSLPLERLKAIATEIFQGCSTLQIVFMDRRSMYYRLSVGPRDDDGTVSGLRCETRTYENIQYLHWWAKYEDLDCLDLLRL